MYYPGFVAGSFIFVFMWFALVLYSLWLLIFPVLLYTRLGDILQELRKMRLNKNNGKI